MSLWSALFGDSERDREIAARREESERILEHEAPRFNQAVQNVESSGRVMRNMAGMMHIMSVNSRIHDDQ